MEISMSCKGRMAAERSTRKPLLIPENREVVAEVRDLLNKAAFLIQKTTTNGATFAAFQARERGQIFQIYSEIDQARKDCTEALRNGIQLENLYRFK